MFNWFFHNARRTSKKNRNARRVAVQVEQLEKREVLDAAFGYASPARLFATPLYSTTATTRVSQPRQTAGVLTASTTSTFSAPAQQLIAPPGANLGRPNFRWPDKFAPPAPKPSNTRVPVINYANDVLEIFGTTYGDFIKIKQNEPVVANPRANRGTANFTAFNFNSVSVTVTPFGNSPAKLTRHYFGVEKIIVYAGNGNDRVENNSDIDSVLHGGDGFDHLYGGSGNDELHGGRHSDKLYGRAGDDVYHIGGSYHQGWDTITELGREGSDTLNFSKLNAGVTVALGKSGVQKVSNYSTVIFNGGTLENIVGTRFDDTLIGDNNNNSLYGGDGNDGLFDGNGTDHLFGQGGADRFLLLNATTFTDQGLARNFIDERFRDVQIDFANGAATTVRLDGSDYDFAAGTWSADEIIQMDELFQVMQNESNNTKLLKTSGGGRLSFTRRGDALTDGSNFLAWNGSGAINIAQPAYEAGDGWLDQIVYHEIGHNWENENPFWDEFQVLSGWTNVAPDRSVAHLFERGTAEAQDWWHLRDARFAREYGRTNPLEDFATAFAAYFMQRSGLTYNGGRAANNSDIGAANIPEKIQLIDRWIRTRVRSRGPVIYVDWSRSASSQNVAQVNRNQLRYQNTHLVTAQTVAATASYRRWIMSAV